MSYPLLKHDNSVSNCMSDESKTDTGFLVGLPVFGANFWYVCHGHNTANL